MTLETIQSLGDDPRQPPGNRQLTNPLMPVNVVTGTQLRHAMGHAIHRGA
jgi:hypothetical protein